MNQPSLEICLRASLFGVQTNHSLAISALGITGDEVRRVSLTRSMQLIITIDITVKLTGDPAGFRLENMRFERFDKPNTL